MINDLTKRLLAEGWTLEHHPDDVYWSDFENFGYKWERLLEMNWETGCGLCVEPREAARCDTTYDGVWYCPENGNPAIRCPYGRKDCPHLIPNLKFPWCVLHQTDTPYDRERSVEKVESELQSESTKRYMEIAGGQYCICVVGNSGYNGGTFEVKYDVDKCIMYKCANQFCSIRKKERNLEPVNIFYDVRRTWITRTGFLEDTRTEIEKGCKVFKKPVARTDAEIWLKEKKAQFDPFIDKSVIEPHFTQQDYSQLYFTKHHRKWPGYDYFELRYSVENIRIEKRETRDLLQDLQDMEEGIEVIHVSDREKAAKAQKSERREKAREVRIYGKRQETQKEEDEQMSLF